MFSFAQRKPMAHSVFDCYNSNRCYNLNHSGSMCAGGIVCCAHRLAHSFTANLPPISSALTAQTKIVFAFCHKYCVFLTLQRSKMRIRFHENIQRNGAKRFSVRCISEQIAFRESRSKGQKTHQKQHKQELSKAYSGKRKKKSGSSLVRCRFDPTVFFSVCYWGCTHTLLVSYYFLTFSMRCVFLLHRRIKQEAGKKWQRRIFQMK